MDEKSVKSDYWREMEKKWEEHPAKKILDDITKKAGIDMSKWYFSEYDDLYYSGYMTVYLYNKNVEDIGMMVEFHINKQNIWELENLEISMD